MKVVVMGAGVIGVTTAYYLAKQGAEVVVIDRQTGPGLETSYANAGQLSYGMTSPWAGRVAGPVDGPERWTSTMTHGVSVMQA